MSALGRPPCGAGGGRHNFAAGAGSGRGTVPGWALRPGLAAAARAAAGGRAGVRAPACRAPPGQSDRAPRVRGREALPPSVATCAAARGRGGPSSRGPAVCRALPGLQPLPGGAGTLR